MNELENNNNLEADLMPAKKTKKTEFSWLETAIQVRRNDLSFPALQAMFELNEVELQAILDKLGPAEDCNC
jgi:hypothetical protein